jgi:putative transposase
MARQLRVEYQGALYHLLNRGDHREPIFHDDSDCHCFVQTLEEVCEKTAWQVHSYALIPNHFHLVIETPQPNLVAGMQWLLGTYTSRFNRRHRLTGHLFAGRYKSLIVDGSGNGYLKTVCDYVHLNPARAKLVMPGRPLKDYRWSSWPAYLSPPSRRPPWLRVDRLLSEHGIPKDSPAGRRELERRVEEWRKREAKTDYGAIQRGWCLGNDDFRKELLEMMSERMGPEHYGAERGETDAEKAQRIVSEELEKRNWREKDLVTRAKGDEEKVKIALRLRAETVQTVKWIADRLSLGARSYATKLLWLASQTRPE